MTTPELAYADIEKLIKGFKALPAAQRKSMNEMQTRLGYILPLFKALGWDTSNINEVSPEEKVSRGWVDFSFRLGNVPRFFLETKKVNEDLNDPRWVKQTIDYAWTKSVTWALLSDTISQMKSGRSLRGVPVGRSGERSRRKPTTSGRTKLPDSSSTSTSVRIHQPPGPPPPERR